MKSKSINLRPVARLLDLHRQHTSQYYQDFNGLNLLIFPNVFNPAFTNVTRLLADNLKINQNDFVLDMFCGSGALGLLASENSDKVIGVDLSAEAIKCAKANAERMGLSGKIEFRHASLWKGVKKNEKFDLIIANPPLLPVTPETMFERAFADSPHMTTMVNFISNCSKYLKNNGRVVMAFSNISNIVFKDPLEHISRLASETGLSMRIIAEKDVEYEIYRVLEFRKI
jgi:methylase of polypeptide subunit release factors